MFSTVPGGDRLIKFIEWNEEREELLSILSFLFLPGHAPCLVFLQSLFWLPLSLLTPQIQTPKFNIIYKLSYFLGYTVSCALLFQFGVSFLKMRRVIFLYNFIKKLYFNLHSPNIYCNICLLHSSLYAQYWQISSTLHRAAHIVYVQ